MALVGATTWTMYLSRRRGTMHSFRTVARSGGSTRISKACNKDRPLQTIKARFLYLQYLSSDPRKDGILIPFPYRICVQTVPQGESYNFIGTLRGDSLQQGVVASSLETSTRHDSIFYSSWNWIGTCSGGISLFDPV